MKLIANLFSSEPEGKSVEGENDGPTKIGQGSSEERKINDDEMEENQEEETDQEEETGSDQENGKYYQDLLDTQRIWSDFLRLF